MKNNDFLTVKEASEYLKINEKKLYDLASNKLIPATKATGKWLFPLESLKKFLKTDSLKNLKSNQIEDLLDKNIILFAGSDDFILNKIFNLFHDKYNEIEIYYSSIGSHKGFEILKNNQSHGVMAHIFDNKHKNYNFKFANEYLGKDTYTIINIFKREIGLVSKENISSFDEIKKNNMIFLNRQKGSGIRTLSDNLISDKNIKFYEKDFTSHFDIARNINEIPNSVCIASKIAANIFKLHFNKIILENFDLIIKKELFFHKNIQLFLNFLRKNIQTEFNKIDGYDFKYSGEIILNNGE